MRVLVTGGTGFIGAATVRALVDAGHELRLLVRTPSKIGPALEPLGIPAPPFEVGDATDAAAVASAMTDCDAVLHAASVFSYDARERETCLTTNLRCTEVVLGTAVDLGLDPVVYVSSYVALLTGRREHLTPESPVGRSPHFYPASKAAAEEVARRFQAQGAPVVITYPGAVFGPHFPDPHGESAQVLLGALRRNRQLTMDGGLSVVDVRDVAAAHAALMEPGRGPRRYLLSGHHMSYTELLTMVGTLTGRPYKLTALPTGLALRAGRLADAAQRVLPLRLPIHHGGAWVLSADPELDDSATLHDLPVTFRSAEETIRDAIAGLRAAGHVSDRQAGLLASATA
jgi:nucleoside-diphosphate-sugar epimerase